MSRTLDNYVTCPFNKCHIILATRLKHHISKCNICPPETVACPYNANHRIPQEQMDEHVAVCPDRVQKA